MKLLKKLVVVFVVLLWSCENDEVKIEKDKPTGKVELITASTEGRVNLDVSFIELSQSNDLFKSKSTAASSFDYELIRRASVASPMHGDKLLRASHIDIEGNYAFVAYNYEGDDFFGGIDVFDVSEIREPVLVTSAYINFTDISAVKVKGTKVYLAGGVDVDKTLADDEKTPSMIKVLDFDGTNLIEDSEILLQGHVATGIEVDDNYIYATTGDNGSYYKIDKVNDSIVAQKKIDDLRSIAFSDNNELYLLAGNPAKLILPNLSWQEYLVEGATTLESKSYIDAKGYNVYVPLNESGLKIVDGKLGTVIQTFNKPQTPSDGVESDYVTNGVDVLENFMFVADGGAGLNLYMKPESGDYSSRAIANLNASANFIESKRLSEESIVIFVATGTKGLQILELIKKKDFTDNLPPTDDKGAPTDVDKTTVNDTIITDFAEFIKTKIVPKGKDYDTIIKKLPPHIELLKDAEVWITFVSEGAGYHNTLGYYSFDINDAPTSVDEIKNKNIIIPNSSAKGSGGNMEKGDRISLGKFPAGTGIGFVLFSNAWKPNKNAIGTPYWTLYTNPKFNPKNYNQNLFLYEPNTNTTILSYEDILISGGDRDYDDLIYLINTDSDAINTSALIDMGQYLE
jgi:hypothetical protein